MFFLNILTSTGLFTTILVTLLTFIVFRFLFIRQRNLPPGPIGLPFLGYLPFIFGADPEKLRELSKKYGDVMSFKLFGVNIVHLGSYDAIYEAFVTRGNEFAERPVVEALRLAYPRTLGVIFSQDDSWKIHRPFALRTLRDFGFGRHSIEERIQEIATDVIKELEESNQRPIDTKDMLSNATANVISSLAFDKHFKMNEPVFVKLMENLKMLFKVPFLSLFLSGPIMKFIPIKRIPGVSFLLRSHEVFREIMADFIEEHQKTFDPNFLRDYVDVYLNQMKEDEKNGQAGKSTFTLDRLIAMATDFFVAGTETSSNTINWAFWFLMYRPEIQKKVQEEIDDVIGRERLPENKDRMKMPYTEAVIQEVLRISSLIPLGVFRSNPGELTFRNYTIPKNSFIIPNLWAVHFDPKEWPEPDKFDPTRFLGENGELVKRSNLCPFELGKRSCLAESLARTEIFIFLTSILQRFHVSPPDGATEPPLKISLGFFVRSLETFYICFHKRR